MATAKEAEKGKSEGTLIERLVNFLKDVRNEVQKVTWPGQQEIKSATVVVIVVCIILSVIIWGMDFVIQSLINVIF